MKTAKNNAKSTTRVHLHVARELQNCLEIWIRERGFEGKIPDDNKTQAMLDAIVAEGRELVMGSIYAWLRRFQEVATATQPPLQTFQAWTRCQHKWHHIDYPKILRRRPNHPADFKLFEQTARIVHCNFGARLAKTDPISNAHLLGEILQGLVALKLQRSPDWSVRIPDESTWIEVGDASNEALHGLHKTLRTRKISATSIEATLRLLESHFARGGNELSPIQQHAESTGIEICRPGQLQIQPGTHRRDWGVHFTPPVLCRELVRRSLSPLLLELEESTTPEQRFSTAINTIRICDPAMGGGVFLLESLRYLDAWLSQHSIDYPGQRSALQTIASQCLYGVDRDALTRSIAVLSLDLAACPIGGARIVALELHLRCGDALVSLRREEIINNKIFTLEKNAKRQIISNEDSQQQDVARDKNSTRQLLARANLLISAYFDWTTKAEVHPNPTARKRVQRLSERLDVKDAISTTECIARLRFVREKIRPFHWELEFPELFSPSRGKLRVAVIGNPPFLGGRYVTQHHGRSYNQWLAHRSLAPATADLCSHFVPLAAQLVGDSGVIGLIVSASIVHDGSRIHSLEALCRTGFEIYDACTEGVWEGAASVAISTFCAARGLHISPAVEMKLNHQEVSGIDAHLRAISNLPGDDIEFRQAPKVLPEAPALAFQGSNIRGPGFLITRVTAQHMLAQDENIVPYIREFFDGKSIRAPQNTQPTQAIIDVGNLDIEELARYPILFQYLSTHVRAQRASTRQAASREQWWRYWNRRIGLYRAIQDLERCIATVLVTRRPAFVFAPTRNIVFGHKLAVFALSEDWQLAVLQSRIHTIWARHHCGARGHHSLTYAPTKCFNNFVPPTHSWQQAANPDFRKFAKTFVTARDAALVDQNLGIAEYYQKLYDAKFTASWIEFQREMHRQLDEQVLAQYGEAFPVPPALATGELQIQFERRIQALLYGRLQSFTLPDTNSSK